MSGETSEHEFGWTVDTLKYYLDSKIQELHQELIMTREQMDAKTTMLLVTSNVQHQAISDAAVAQAESNQRALERNERSMEKRFDGVNEFRAQLSDQARTFMTRAEYEGKHESLVDRLGELQARLDRSQGERQGVHASGAVITAVVAGLASLIVIVNITIALFNR